MQSTRNALTALVGIAAAALLAACGGGDSPASSPTATGMGTLKVALTDAPGCRIGNEDLQAVNVTVERVRVHASSDDNPSANGWHDIIVRDPVTGAPGPRRINLLDLTNGRLEELGTMPIPAGTYQQVRLVLTSGNSIVLAGSPPREESLRTPSAQQSGLKIVPGFTVAPNTTVDLVIDFDACRSIVQLGRGNGGYLLKPVLTAELKQVSGIVGYIDVDPPVPGVMVSAQNNGRVVRSTVPDASGRFVLAFLASAGSPYDVVITAPGKATMAVAGVPATTVATEISTPAARIELADSPMAAATGKVNLAAAAALASVRALQAVGTVPVLEVGHDNVDPSDGSYALSLPTAAARFAAFGALPLAFAPAGSDSRYQFHASAPGFASQTKPDGPVALPATQDFDLVPLP